MRRILPFFLLFSVCLFGQKHYNPELFQFSDGLPSDAILMTLKKDGFLYIATQRGLCLYDGYVFISSPDVQNTIFNLTQKDGELYGEELGTGIFKVDDIYSTKKTVAPVNYMDTLQDNDHYQNVYKDSIGNIWSSDFHFIKFTNPQNNNNTEFRVEENNKALNLLISYFETPEEVILASSKGLYVWGKKSETFNQLNDISFYSGLESNGKILLLSKKGELFEYFPISHNTVSLQKIPITTPCKLVKKCGNKDVIVLYDMGNLYHYDMNSGKLETVYTSQEQINHVLFDEATHIFWISTQKGLVKLTRVDSAIQTIALPDSPSGPVTDLIEDEKSQIWMVKNSRNIFVETNEKLRQVRIPEEQINRFSFTGNRLLIGTSSGVYEREKNENFRKIISTDFSVKKAVFFDEKYWLLPENGAIRVYESKTKKEIPKYIQNDEEYWKINLFNDVEVSADNQLWLASWMPRDFGISKFSKSESKFVEISSIPGNEEAFTADYYNRISQLSSGNLVFSSTGGLNIVNPKGEIVHSMYSRENNVACDNLDGIAEDKNGNIWFGCSEGLYHYNKKTRTPIRISKVDGLASNNIKYGFLISKNNTLYISDEKTLEKINPDEILKSELINELKLTALKINSKYYPTLSNEFSFKEKDAAQIELLFSALNFSQKDKLIYRYKFNQEEWQYLGSEPKLSLIKLTPGKYDIAIEVGDNLGNWQKNKLEIKLNIIPPFHKTIWFLIIVAACFFTGAHFFNVYLVRQEKEKGELKKRIKDNENKMLRSQMNPHFLFNSLNSINSFILQNKTEEAEKYLTAFSKLMRNILDNSRKETISLKQELETVKLYLDLEAVRLENKFDYRISVSKNVDIDYVQIPPLILQPFLENVIWHGINYKQGDGFINIDVANCDKEDNILIIKIMDDGVGRKAASKLKNKKYAHKSYGIEITKERLELQGAYNSIEITDLYDDSKEPSGTLVTFKIHTKND